MNNVVLPDISPEILHNIFFFVQATDLASIRQTCRLMRDFVDHDELLWKRLYLANFNEPRRIPPSWTAALKNLVRTEKILRSNDYDLKRTNTALISNQMLALLLGTTESSPRQNINFLTQHFHHAHRRSNASTFLRQSSLFRRCGTPDDLPGDNAVLRQLSARLHVYSALPLEIRETEYIDLPGSNYMHPYARSRVYDLRRYNASNFWGPYMDDGSGRVDWEKVQSIWIVLGYGLRMLSERTNGTVSGGGGWGMGLNGEEGMWEGLGTSSYRSMTVAERAQEEDKHSNAATTGSSGCDPEDDSSDDVPPLEWFQETYTNHPKEARWQHEQAIFAKQDPYGVKGTWMRIVNFLDYHDLFAFNFTGRQDLARHEERDPVTTAEAFRLILLTLWVTKIEWEDEEISGPDDWETVAGSQASSPAATRDEATPTPDEQADDGDGQLEEVPDTPMSNTDTEPLPSPPPNGKTRETRKAKYPTVYFEGRSRSLHIRWDPNANSHIRGHVRAYPSPAAPASSFVPDHMQSSKPDLSHVYLNRNDKTGNTSTQTENTTDHTPGLAPEDDLVVRWTTFSVFHGEERWRSEGVQIGGLKSARGILGNWFDKDFDPHGPAGPTGFWKMGDGVEFYGPRNQERAIWTEDDD